MILYFVVGGYGFLLQVCTLDVRTLSHVWFDVRPMRAYKEGRGFRWLRGRGDAGTRLWTWPVGAAAPDDPRQRSLEPPSEGFRA